MFCDRYAKCYTECNKPTLVVFVLCSVRFKLPITILPKDDAPPFLINNIVFTVEEGQVGLDVNILRWLVNNGKDIFVNKLFTYHFQDLRFSFLKLIFLLFILFTQI